MPAPDTDEDQFSDEDEEEDSRPIISWIRKPSPVEVKEDTDDLSGRGFVPSYKPSREGLGASPEEEEEEGDDEVAKVPHTKLVFSRPKSESILMEPKPVVRPRHGRKDDSKVYYSHKINKQEAKQPPPPPTRQEPPTSQPPPEPPARGTTGPIQQVTLAYGNRRSITRKIAPRVMPKVAAKHEDTNPPATVHNLPSRIAKQKEAEQASRPSPPPSESPPPPPPPESPPPAENRPSVRRREKRRKLNRERVKMFVNMAGAKSVVLAAAHSIQAEFVLLRDSAQLLWIDRSITVETMRSLVDEKQRVNKFPGMKDLCNKVLFTHHLNRMQSLFPEDFDFYPKTMCIPGDEDELHANIPLKRRRSTQSQGQKKRPSGGRRSGGKASGKTWIVKPSKGAQGNGIFLTRNLADLEAVGLNIDAEKPTEGPQIPYVVQEYIQNPLLIDGLKFDLRIYVLVLSVEPLKVYVFKEGLSRFATNAYKGVGDLGDPYQHLTNYSLNKDNENFVTNTDITNLETGSKRNLESVSHWLRNNGHDVDAVWKSIHDVILKTMLALQPSILVNLESVLQPADDYNKCFQILGFDIMLDEDLKPWLLEINAGPSLETDSPIDVAVKEPLVTSALKLGTFGLLPKHKGKCRQAYEKAHSGMYKCVYPSPTSYEYEHLCIFNREMRACFDKACGLRKGDMSATRFCKFFRDCGIIRSFKQIGDTKGKRLELDYSPPEPAKRAFATNKAFALRSKSAQSAEHQRGKEGDDDDEQTSPPPVDLIPPGYEPKYGLKTFAMALPPKLESKVRMLTQPELELLFLRRSKAKPVSANDLTQGLSFYEFFNIVLELAKESLPDPDFAQFTTLEKLRIFISRSHRKQQPSGQQGRDTPAQLPPSSTSSPSSSPTATTRHPV